MPRGRARSPARPGWSGRPRGRGSRPPGRPGVRGLAAGPRAGEAASAGIGVVTRRSGVVLSPNGGILGKLLPLFRLGVGGRIGSGKQVMSWIGLSEWAAAARFLLGRADIAGPVNLTTPNPVSNAEFTAALAAALHRPAVMLLPVPALKLA